MKPKIMNMLMIQDQAELKIRVFFLFEQSLLV
jgi:hypothetical protein